MWDVSNISELHRLFIARVFVDILEVVDKVFGYVSIYDKLIQVEG